MDREDELLLPPGGAVSITTLLPQVKIGVLRRSFRVRPQLVVAAGEGKMSLKKRKKGMQSNCQIQLRSQTCLQESLFSFFLSKNLANYLNFG